MKYTDKEGKEVKAGDILWYSEPVRYANSMHIVSEKDGVLYGETRIGNNGEYFPCRERPIELRFYCSFPYNDYKMQDATVIGNINDNPEMLTVKYANKNYPLK